MENEGPRPRQPADVGVAPPALAAADELLSLCVESRSEPSSQPAVAALALAVGANLPVLLWGQPGIGKTAVLNQVGAELGVVVETVVASVHEPSDFAGLPVLGPDPGSEGVPMAPPDWAVRLARAGHGLLFFDELSSAPPAVQAALLRVVLERRVGSLALPAPIRIVAAANPAASAADGWHLSAPLANRFVHLDWVHDPRVVARGIGGTWPSAVVPRIDPAAAASAVARARGTVAGFLSARPGLVHMLPREAEERGRAWPSPRTWEMVARLLAFGFAARAEHETLAAAVAGAVGPAAGIEFLTFLAESDLPDPDLVLADPAAFALPERGDRQLAFLTAVVAAVRAEPTRQRWDAAWRVLEKAVAIGAPDIAAQAALDLAVLRNGTDWPAPPALDAFVEVLRLSGRLTPR